MTSVQAPGLVRWPISDGSSHWTVRAMRETTYDVVVSWELFDIANPTLATAGNVPAACPGARRLIVIDSTVDRLYGDKIRHYFLHCGVTAVYHVIEAHEVVKSWDSVSSCVSAMAAAGIDRRNDPVICIGGGVLLDIVGFAASIYRRSTPYIRIPTTLIGLVDAGVGIKTGINFGREKNKIGTYAAPTVSYIDSSFLRTLNRRHIANGLAEIFKLALIKSTDLMFLLERHGNSILDDGFFEAHHTLVATADTIITTAIQLMLEELQPNLWEKNLERCVDFGHTFSPTIEMKDLPKLLHGEAVQYRHGSE